MHLQSALFGSMGQKHAAGWVFPEKEAQRFGQKWEKRKKPKCSFFVLSFQLRGDRLLPW